MSTISTGTLSQTSSTALGTVHMNNIAGMDVDSLVAATMSVAQLPLVAMQSQQQMLQAQVTDFNTIAASLSALQTSMSTLTDSSSFQANAATTSNANVVAATSNNNSVTGSYNLNVTSLATASYVSSAGTALQGFSAGTKAIFTGTVGTGTGMSTSTPNAALGSSGGFKINGQSITYTATDTINTVLNQITASAAGVNASLSTSGQIILTQKTAGASPTISVGSDSGQFLTATGLGGGMLTPGTNATETQTLATALGTNAVTAGYFSINGTYIAVDPTTDTLDSMVSKINSSNAGVQAFYDANANKITLTSTTPGNTAVQLGTYGTTDTSNFLSTVGLSQSNEITGTAAQVTVNGVAVTPTGNTLAMNGNTFTLLGPGQSTVTVAQNTSSIVTQIQAFVTQYNATIDLVMGKLDEQTVSDPTTTADQTAGDLNGNGTLQQILTQLQNYASTVVGAQPASMQQLSQVGITTGAVGQSVAASESGHLSLDTTVLTAALESNPQAVASLFGQSNINVANEAVGTGNGSLPTFNLAHTNVSQPTIQVTTGGNTVTYNQVSGTPLADPTDGTAALHQYSINYTTGQITFGTPPVTGATISASYTYDVSQGNQAGIFVQMSNYLNSLTEVGGAFDTITGSNGSLTNQISSKKNQISAMNTYLQTYQATLYTEYNASSVLLNQLKSQESILTALSASSSSSSS